MKRIKIENGVIVGTSGDKFSTKNPAAIYLLKGFARAIIEIIQHLNPKTVLEVGCGEGYVTRLLLEHTQAEILATDISKSVLDQTRSAIISRRVRFQTESIETLAVQKTPDLVVCCQVLEHLPDPLVGLHSLYETGAEFCLLSVPFEPIWRILNMARGAYLQEWGNSPGHLHHWSKKSFLGFLSEKFNPVLVKCPLPWIIVLCGRR